MLQPNLNRFYCCDVWLAVFNSPIDISTYAYQTHTDNKFVWKGSQFPIEISLVEDKIFVYRNVIIINFRMILAAREMKFLYFIVSNTTSIFCYLFGWRKRRMFGWIFVSVNSKYLYLLFVSLNFYTNSKSSATRFVNEHAVIAT